MADCLQNRPVVIETDLGYGEEAYGQDPYGGAVAPAPPVPNPGPGYTTPSATNQELNDQLFRLFLQPMIVGITGMQAQLVRPRWQPEPPNQPDFSVDWAAVGAVGQRTRDTFAAVLHCTDPGSIVPANVTGNGKAYVIRNEILEILCSFYGPNCDANSEVLAMGLMLEQNRYVMQLNGFALVEVGDSLVVPALTKDRWLTKMDLSFRMRRQQKYTYSSPNLLAAQGAVGTDGLVKPFTVTGAKGYGKDPFGEAPFGPGEI